MADAIEAISAAVCDAFCPTTACRACSAAAAAASTAPATAWCTGKLRASADAGGAPTGARKARLGERRRSAPCTSLEAGCRLRMWRSGGGLPASPKPGSRPVLTESARGLRAARSAACSGAACGDHHWSICCTAAGGAPASSRARRRALEVALRTVSSARLALLPNSLGEGSSARRNACHSRGGMACACTRTEAGFARPLEERAGGDRACSGVGLCGVASADLGVVK